MGDNKPRQCVRLAVCDDEAILAGYRRFNEVSRKKVTLLSNDRGFVERSVDAGLPARVVDYLVGVPLKPTGSRTQATELLYYLAVLFGAVTLPKVTVHGVWNGRDGRHWQHDQVDIDCRSPKVPPQLKRDVTILGATE